MIGGIQSAAKSGFNDTILNPLSAKPGTVLGCIISLMYVTGPIAFYGIWCYTGERKDRINKYVYYAFYPLHLLVLGVIANYIL